MNCLIQHSGDLNQWLDTRMTGVNSLAVRDAFRSLLSYTAEQRGLNFGEDWGDFLGEAQVWLMHWREFIIGGPKAPAVLVDVVEHPIKPITLAEWKAATIQDPKLPPPAPPAELPPRPWKLMTLWERPDLLPHVTAEELSRMVSQVVEVMRAGVRAADHIDSAYDPSF